MIKLALFAVAFKSAIMSATILLVLASSFTDFDKGLIIAAVSATITGVFTVLASWLTIRHVRPVDEKMTQVRDDVHAVKRVVGADKREGDDG